MEPQHRPTKPGRLAWRSLILPAAGSALVSLLFGMGYACEPGPGPWVLLAAPAFAAIGAVGGPERDFSSRIIIGLGSTVLNAVIMLGLVTAITWMACSY